MKAVCMTNVLVTEMVLYMTRLMLSIWTPPVSYTHLAKLYINWAVYTCDDVATYDPSMTNSKLNDVIIVDRTFHDDLIAFISFQAKTVCRLGSNDENASGILG